MPNQTNGGHLGFNQGNGVHGSSILDAERL